MKHHTNPKAGRSKGRTSRRRRLVMAGLVATTASAGIIAASAGAASATEADPQPAPTDYTVEVFRETIKPWDSITIPSTSCGGNYLLENKDFSPGRVVPRGVEIVEPGGVGVTITNTAYKSWNPKGTEVFLHYGTDASKGASTATNWDPFSSHEVVVKLHCTIDWGKAVIGPPTPDLIP